MSEAANPSSTAPLQVLLVTGMSGSGKSVALRALEDAGYYCVDNLPPELVRSFIDVEQNHRVQRIAIAMDVRSAKSLPLVPEQIAALRQMGVQVKVVFLDANTPTLVQRFSETRRRHPLSASDAHDADQQRALIDAIEWERELLADLRELAHVIDSSLIRAAQLQSYIKQLIAAPQSQLTLVFESFGFKRGLPMDADYVFDVRMLPNPHYENDLRQLTGRDAPVQEFLKAQADVGAMFRDVQEFLKTWLPKLAQDHRSYVTVAMGCTGGQHRSVFLVEELARHFSTQYTCLKRHREMDGHVFAQSVF